MFSKFYIKNTNSYRMKENERINHKPYFQKGQWTREQNIYIGVVSDKKWGNQHDVHSAFEKTYRGAKVAGKDKKNYSIWKVISVREQCDLYFVIEISIVC